MPYGSSNSPVSGYRSCNFFLLEYRKEKEPPLTEMLHIINKKEAKGVSAEWVGDHRCVKTPLFLEKPVNTS